MSAVFIAAGLGDGQNTSALLAAVISIIAAVGAVSRSSTLRGGLIYDTNLALQQARRLLTGFAVTSAVVVLGGLCEILANGPNAAGFFTLLGGGSVGGLTWWASSVAHQTRQHAAVLDAREAQVEREASARSAALEVVKMMPDGPEKTKALADLASKMVELAHKPLPGGTYPTRIEIPRQDPPSGGSDGLPAIESGDPGGESQ